MAARVASAAANRHHPGMTDAAHRFAVHVAETRFHHLPPAAVERAKVFLLDTLGVAMAGSTAQGAAETLVAARQWGAGAQASVLGGSARLPAAQAVLVNAFQIHCQEYDCLHEGAVLHALATLLPVLLAEAQRRPISGPALLTALAVGVDVSCGLGLAAKQGMRFFRPATSGGFGAVAGLASLRGYSAAQTLAAFGLHYGQVSGTMQAHVEGSPVLPLQVGVNARAAWQACDLAEAGLPGLAEVFEGRFGYLPLYEAEWDLAPILAGLGRRWLVAELSHKPFPSGRATHGGVEGVMALRAAHGFHAEEVAEVVVQGPPLILRLVNRPLPAAPSANWARLCMPFVLAKLLQHGVVDLAQFRGAALVDPVTHALAGRIRMVDDGNPDPNALAPQRVQVRLRDGRVLEHAMAEMLAAPTRPLDEARHLAKFQRCLEFAAQPAPWHGGLVQAVADIEAATDVGAALLGG